MNPSVYVVVSESVEGATIEAVCYDIQTAVTSASVFLADKQMEEGLVIHIEVHQIEGEVE